jgi:hypothetical protein
MTVNLLDWITAATTMPGRDEPPPTVVPGSEPESAPTERSPVSPILYAYTPSCDGCGSPIAAEDESLCERCKATIRRARAERDLPPAVVAAYIEPPPRSPRRNAPREAMVEISGNTYPVREAIKGLGGRWNAGPKTWSVPAARAEEARALVAAAGNVRGRGAPRRRDMSGRCVDCGAACPARFATCFACK